MFQNRFSEELLHISRKNSVIKSLFDKKKTPTQVCSYEYGETFKKTKSRRHFSVNQTKWLWARILLLLLQLQITLLFQV